MRRAGKSYAHPLLVLVVKPNELNQPRIGVTAGRSIGNAVKRARAKRLLRAAAAPLISQIHPAGVDLILIARRPILEKKSQDVQAALLRKLKQAELIQADAS